MNTDTAIALLEELGSSEDPVELYGTTKELYGKYGIKGRDTETPNQLDVGLVGEANKLQIRYYSGQRKRHVYGTLSGMVADRAVDRRRTIKGIKTCRHCGGVL